MDEEQKNIAYRDYAQLICEPKHWLDIAQSLYAAAEKLEPEINRLWRDMRDSMFQPGYARKDEPFQAFEYQRVYLMLIGFALENLFKGFLVGIDKENKRSVAHRTGALPPDLKTHDLKKLLKKCPLRLSAEQQEVLRYITAHSEWIGRYPYPTKAEEYFHFEGSSRVPGNTIGWSSGHVAEIKKLVDEIAEQLGTSIHVRKGGTPT